MRTNSDDDRQGKEGCEDEQSAFYSHKTDLSQLKELQSTVRCNKLHQCTLKNLIAQAYKKSKIFACLNTFEVL